MAMIVALTRRLLGVELAALALVSALAAGCAETSASNGGGVRVVKNEESAAPTGGIPPDKQAEIQLLLQQRDPSTLKCYQDVLDEKKSRAFKGSVTVELTVVPGGKASDVRVTGGSLNNKEVSDCLIAKLKDFEYPDVPSAGTMQYVYRFEPAY
jgi:hypothetical protein